MALSCIRLAGIVSRVAKQYGSFATAPSLRPIVTRSRFFSVSTPRPRPITQDVAVSPSEVRYEYTVAQIARAAAQAARVATHEGQLKEAFYVVNSALQVPLEPGIKPPIASRRLLNPLNFGRPVPTRLLVHALIHALVRTGHTIRAGQEMQKMMAMGVRFRYQTIEANVGLLCFTRSRPEQETDQFAHGQVPHRTILKDDWKAYSIIQRESTRLRPETSLALDLLAAARKSRHRRTERMYGWAVDACLLQGEIFVGTLLFVVLVKDWQLRKVLTEEKSKSTAEPTADATADATRVVRLTPDLVFHDLRKRQLAKEIGLDGDHVTIPYPEKTILQSILNGIDGRFFPPDPRSISETAEAEAKKSLAHLAYLIDQKSLPFGQLSPLIRALYRCPRSRTKVRVYDDGCSLNVNASIYVHRVLLKLCRSLPALRPSPSPIHPELLPPLDTRAYNSLIYYALRHRLSPALADAIIDHMTTFRQPPLQPNTVTYNTLLHAVSILRRSDLADQVIYTLHHRFTPGDNLKSKPRSPRSPPPMSSFPPVGGHFLRHAAEELRVPSISNSDGAADQRIDPVHADVYTICTYITHLVRTGNPDIIADHIFHIIPELHIVDHPATSPSAPNPEDMVSSQDESLRRAIAYGPYLYCVLLNALQKAGRTGLAERVWLLARRAESASWMQPEGPDVLAPWRLPIQAYTSMMMCYAYESKKGTSLFRSSRYYNTLSSSLSLMQERQAWQPQRSANVYVRGWAYFHLRLQAQEHGYKPVAPAERWKTAREVGYLLLKSMRSGAVSIWQDLMSAQPGNLKHISPRWASVLNSLKPPVSDARFFNVLLEMFGRRPNMQLRRMGASPSWWTRKLRIAHKVYNESGRMPMAYDHTLVEIARSMAEAGHELPLGLKRALVGRVNFRFRHVQPQERHVRPFAYPRPDSLRHRMFSLPVTKSRGLPLGRRRPDVMRAHRVMLSKQRKRRK